MMTFKPTLRSAMPGPQRRSSVKLPLPPPAGVMPPEDSRLWVFVPKAVQTGESFIQDDTREWFADREFKVQISRDYADHPRWLVNGRESIRAKMHNAHIISEVHMLARLKAGLSDVPAWVPARMTVKQQQADLAYRLVKATRDVWLVEGKGALLSFAQKAPGQFVKFVGSTFIPKQLEVQNIPADTISTEAADMILAEIAAELQRRSDEAKVVSGMPLDYDGGEGAVQNIQDVGEAFRVAVDEEHPGVVSTPGRLEGVRRLGNLVDIMTDADPVDWDEE